MHSYSNHNSASYTFNNGNKKVHAACVDSFIGFLEGCLVNMWDTETTSIYHVQYSVFVDSITDITHRVFVLPT